MALGLETRRQDLRPGKRILITYTFFNKTLSLSSDTVKISKMGVLISPVGYADFPKIYKLIDILFFSHKTS